VENQRLKDELSLVRRDLMEVSVQQSDKMKAIGGKFAGKTRGCTASSTFGRSKSFIVSEKSSEFHSFEHSFNKSFTGSSLSSIHSTDGVDSSFSPLASPKRPQSISLDTRKHPSMMMNNNTSAVSKEDSVQLPYLESPQAGNGKRNEQRKVSNQSTKPKTSFVGSGLGLANTETFSPKGSAKQMLRRIMEDFNSN
jgi:hypothetical protein